VQLSYARVLPAPPGRVYDLLSDPPALAEGVDVLQSLTPAGPDAWDVVVKAGLMTFRGTVRVEDRRPATSVALALEGKGTGGRVQGRVTFRLAARGDGTAVDCAGEAEVGGLLALAGARRLEAAGQQALSDLFDVLAARVTK
jgi:carbon monoxide dehydrogenase subunit G